MARAVAVDSGRARAVALVLVDGLVFHQPALAAPEVAHHEPSGKQSSHSRATPADPHPGRGPHVRVAVLTGGEWLPIVRVVNGTEQVWGTERAI